MNHQRGKAHNVDTPSKPSKPNKPNKPGSKKSKGGNPPNLTGLPGVVAGGVDPQVRVLPLTVNMVAYSYMTGEVGYRGRKKKETRLPSEWIRARLEGKEYDAYLLYGGVGHNERTASWTIFESLGHKLVGEEGVTSIVENYGSDHGFECSITGVRWEISLGKVLCRHYLPCENTPPPQHNCLDVNAAQKFFNEMKPMFEGFMAGMVNGTGTKNRNDEGKPGAPKKAAADDGVITAKDMLELHKHERKEDRKHNEATLDKMVELAKSFSPQGALKKSAPAPAEAPMASNALNSTDHEAELQLQYDAFQKFQQFQKMFRG